MKKLIVLIAGIATVIGSHAATLFSTNETWRLQRGTNEASRPDLAAWRLLNFSDTNFADAPAPFWYGDAYTGGTQIPEMQNGYLCIFLRKQFVITNLAEVAGMQMGARVDDGFAAWINGSLVLTVNPPAEPFTTNSSVVSASPEPVPFVIHDLPNPAGYLVLGTNQLAVQVFNAGIGSTDLGFDASLIQIEPDVTPPAIASKTPAPGTVGAPLSSITIIFNEAVNGVNAADLLINGAAATGVSGTGSNYTFTFPPPALGVVTVAFITDPGIFDLVGNEFDETAPTATWQYNLVDNTPPTIVDRAPPGNTTVETFASIQVTFSESVTNVDASDLLINGVAVSNLVIITPSIYRFEFTAPATGLVTVAFAPGHGIQDLAVPPNAFAGSTWSNVYDPNFQYTAFVITEFLASNSGDESNSLRDEDGDSSDWIEIYNPDNAVADIGGFFLTDATNSLTKWRFPLGTTVPARGYIVVFASGKNRTNVMGRLHTNFQLNNSGEYLGLLTPKTNVISEFYPTYPGPQTTDVSYGRDRNTPALTGYYTTPTPGAHNALSGSGFAPEVEFSQDGSTFTGSFQLQLSLQTPAPNTVIRYTIVSSAQNSGNATNIPTASSTLYTGPITISNSVQVRARAFSTSPNVFPGAPRTESYLQVAGPLTNFVSTLPLVVIHTLGSTAFSGGFPALDNSIIVAFFETNAQGQASLMHTPQLVKRAGINLRGSSTQGFPKSSYAVELWDEFNADEEADVLGMPQESDWVLYAPNYFDQVLIHNPLMHELGKGTGRYSSRFRFVEVFVRNGSGPVTNNFAATGSLMGDYNGIYILEEKVKRDGNRVAIDALEPEHTNAPAITGGYLLKYDRKDENERTFTAGGYTATETTGGVGLSYQDPDGLEMITPARAGQSNYLRNYINFFYAAITGSALTNNTGTNHYSFYFDSDASIDHNILGVVTLNADAMRLSGYIHKPRNGKLAFGPIWDVDRGLGTGGANHNDWRAFNPRGWTATNPLGVGGTDYGTDFFNANNVYANLWYARLFQDPDFWQKWIDRWQELREGPWTSNKVFEIVDNMGALMTPAQPREVARWGGNGASDTRPRNGTITSLNGDYSHTFNNTYQGEINFQKRWLGDRFHFIDTNLLARPGFGQPGGLVSAGTMVTLVDRSGKAGTKIYYTLDGTDPRASQNRTNLSAIEYTGPITVSNNVRITARAINGNHRNLTGTTAPGGANHANPPISSIWSGIIGETYITAVPPLIVTELMYHPAPPASELDTNDVDNFEFIELKNIGSNTLNLAGFRFTNGISFTFGATMVPAGERIVVAKNLGSFTQRYGSLPNVVGPYGDTLDNAGDRVTLIGPALEVVLDFTYSDDWYPLSDGIGFSLVAVDDTTPTDLNTNTSWRLSSVDGGSPGTPNPAPIAIGGVVVVNEALTHTDPPDLDSIELYNPGTNAVNIGGWWLTDDFEVPKKYQIPNATILGPGEFYVVDETAFDVGATGFALGSDGDDVFVFSGTNGFITGYYHGFDFGAAQNGRSFGRYVTSQNDEHFVAQAANTLGTNNSLPLVGPVVISEIMYRPPDAGSGTNIFDNSLDEYIELQNITATNVPLYHTQFPTNTWRLTSAVDFSFPTNVVIPPSNFVVIVSFDPATNGAAFRAKYGVPTNVPLYGPYSGKLDNSAESVRLRRPDAPNGSDVPYILVDQVDYRDHAPWAFEADGFGASLQRLIVQDYGNDPTNWVATRTTVGAPVEGGPPPVILQQPMDITVVEGMPTNISVSVSSPTPVSYQWQRNSNSVPGATNATLIFPSIQLSEAGVYTVSIFNGGGVAFSTQAVVTVRALPRITQQPTNQNVQPGTNVTLSVAVTGTGNIRYQWQFEGTDIEGATNASHSFTNANLDQHHGNFRVIVTDDVDTIISSNAFIYVMVRPVFVIHPQPQTILAGQNATFTAYATGAPPIYYRWLRQGQPQATNLSGVFTLSNVLVTTSVRALATNLASGASGVNMIPAGGVTLTVLADADRDGMADTWETSYFGAVNTTNNVGNAVEDPDGDGMINRDEYVAGTNPTNALSVLKLFLTAGNTVVEFVAQTNISYSVQYRTALDTQNWTTVSNVGAQPSQVRTVQVNAPNPPPQDERYYRVVTPQVLDP